MNIYIIRNAQRFGPYDEKTLLSYVNNGQILKQDKAIAAGDSFEQTVGFYLKRANLKYKVPNNGNIISQLSAIGTELIFPKAKLFSKQFLSDQRFIILALVGLLPMIIMNIVPSGSSCISRRMYFIKSCIPLSLMLAEVVLMNRFFRCLSTTDMMAWTAMLFFSFLKNWMCRSLPASIISFSSMSFAVTWNVPEAIRSESSLMTSSRCAIR